MSFEAGGGGKPVTEISGIGPKKGAALARLGIYDMESAARHYPRSYEDLRKVKRICDLSAGEKALVKAKVISIRSGGGNFRRRGLFLYCEDESGSFEVVFFNAGYMRKAFERGKEYFFFGRVGRKDGKLQMGHPEVFPFEGSWEPKIVPVYPLTRGITQKDMRKVTKAALDGLGGTGESLPLSVIKEEKLCGIDFALRNIHYPKGAAEYSAARYRLIYEEFFDLAIAVKLSKGRFGKGRKGNAIGGRGGEGFIEGLPYALTGAQKRVAREIFGDMSSRLAMNRLLQGDVGSGKTVIAEAAVAKAAKAGFQSAFMAPTELLAVQHFETLTKDFKECGIKAVLLTGAQPLSEKKKNLDLLSSGEADVAVGTHAIISENVRFKKLGLVITDEQHRFGVNQRRLLSEKGENPDVLVMTATPIPRTLAVVLYGDLDISVIDEMPEGRLKIITRKFSEESRHRAYEILNGEVSKGRQAYIVAPFIDDSESIEGRSAEGLYKEFKRKFPAVGAALLHGDMKADEKNRIMSAFLRGEISVLISTVVIEVGINVPNATVMLIENSERFGLAQLHQLRGRVGRGSFRSYCLLVSGEETEISKKRSDFLCQSGDGFEIAEKDLELRGPGEIFGLKQHGLPGFLLADPVKHIEIAKKAGKRAEELLLKDPGLKNTENAELFSHVKKSFLNGSSLTL